MTLQNLVDGGEGAQPTRIDPQGPCPGCKHPYGRHYRDAAGDLRCLHPVRDTKRAEWVVRELCRCDHHVPKERRGQ